VEPIAPHAAKRFTLTAERDEERFALITCIRLLPFGQLTQAKVSYGD